MIRRYALATILLFSLLLTNGNCEDVSDKNFRTECFLEAEERRESDVADCKDSRINIKGTFYKCESALYLKSSIKRIGFMRDDVLVLVGRQNFHIDGNTSDVRPVRRIVPAVTQLMDSKGNIYYGGSNVVYVKRQNDNEFVEIVTNNASESHNEISIDESNGILFILSHYEDDNTVLKKNGLYALSLSSIDSDSSSISAELISNVNDVSSISYNSEKNYLYLGLKVSSGRGKLIKLKGQTNDPCGLDESYRQEIEEAVSDFKLKIINAFEKTSSSIQARVVNDSDSDKVLGLTWENEELAKQLNSTLLQLESLKNRYFNNQRYGLVPQINPSYYDNSYITGIEERMGVSTSKPREQYSQVNIVISPPQVIPLPANGTSSPNIILYPTISISIGGDGNIPIIKSNVPLEEVQSSTSSVGKRDTVISNVTTTTESVSVSAVVSEATTKNKTGSSTFRGDDDNDYKFD